LQSEKSVAVLVIILYLICLIYLKNKIIYKNGALSITSRFKLFGLCIFLLVITQGKGKGSSMIC